MDRIKTDVLIVGAGPTGLSLACQLVRYGIDFIIVEKNEGVTRFSKALGVQARTLEIYEQLGLAHLAVERGTIATKVRMLAGGRVRGEMDISGVGQGQSPYPYILFLEQSKNEELLYEYLRRHQGKVFWNTELESFSQDGDGVTALVKRGDGQSSTITAKYLVGCDGAGSFVRRSLGLTFEGSTFERLFYVADARVDWELPHDAVQVCLARDVFTLFFPMKGERRYRIVGTFPEGVGKGEGKVLYEEIERQIKREARLQLEISEVNWFSLYKVHSRRVNRFSEGRSFVAGDAAHIHSPAGAQGMNTGIQDAYNLAWKLAFVIKGWAGEELLETYNEERLQNAKRLLETTDRIFELAAGTNWLLGLLRTTVFPRLAGFLATLGPIRKRFFPLISQIGITYRALSLSDSTDDAVFSIRAGDRMPNVRIEGQSIYEKLRAPKFHLLVFSEGGSDNQRMKDELKDEYHDTIDCQVFSLDSSVKKIFGTNEPFTLLLRPDNHVAFISAEISPGRVRAYLSRVLTGSSSGKTLELALASTG
ncbi:MAG TPA: FAD-dependent monooxygenase [Pyrinomonadaceae bacterium]|jgi:2-polyprenyl-6-methoxyphenol hydroxylase-like FAD-dependent oxidoreductase